MHYDLDAPLPSASGAMLADPSAVGSRPGAPTVLVIEDDPLKARGYGVIGAGDGLQGLAACRAHAPDLVLLDVQLPGLGGVEVAKAISSGPDAPPIMAVSAFAGEPERARLRTAGCAACLPKPVAIAELLSRIDQLAAEPGA